MERVAITGMGAICGLGHDLTTVWDGVVNGKSGISQIEEYDAENFSAKIAGEVKKFSISEDILDAKEASRYDRFIHFALQASYEAYAQAGLAGDKTYSPERQGCILGVGLGGFPSLEKNMKLLFDRGPRRVSPFCIPALIPNMAPGLVTIKLNLKGINYSVASACASGAHALGNAAQEIMLGRQDVVITGGSESGICGIPLAGFINMKALSKNSGDPTKVSRPFDSSRDGFVIGEGAGILVLENFEKAKARGATIYAEVVGWGSSSDAHHITAPHPEGIGAIQCMRQTLDTAKLPASVINHVNAHGTSTPLGDVAEIKALKELCGDHAKNIKITSTKSMTGHLLGAAGGIESIFCVKALHEGIIPPTINLENLDPEIDLNIVSNVAQKFDGEYALNNSFGFGGTNSSVLIKRV